jgi:DtxR family Mn-dependent transcriptional regulator|tara:strand:- start:219 stop:929 length:711 start_codon:yes stop_codon:yes gene_type:complete
MTEQGKQDVPRLTQAMENYLLSIYVVLERGEKVSNSNLVGQLRRVPASENLGTSLPAVSGMLRRMEKELLIRLGDSRDIDLTTRGRGLAESMIRKHRLAARMVVDLLDVPLHEVDAEAHMLEHALSDTLEKRIQEKLGNPKTDPFGQPIPGSGYREPKGVVTLDNAPMGVPMIVDRIPEDDAELVRYLYESGVLPGVEVVVADVAPYRGVVTLQIGDETAVLGYNVSGDIRLRTGR